MFFSKLWPLTWVWPIQSQNDGKGIFSNGVFLKSLHPKNFPYFLGVDDLLLLQAFCSPVCYLLDKDPAKLPIDILTYLVNFEILLDWVLCNS